MRGMRESDKTENVAGSRATEQKFREILMNNLKRSNIITLQQPHIISKYDHMNRMTQNE